MAKDRHVERIRSNILGRLLSRRKLLHLLQKAQAGNKEALAHAVSEVESDAHSLKEERNKYSLDREYPTDILEDPRK